MEKELIVKWKIRETETSRILNLLPELVEKSSNEPGNLSYAVYQSENKPNEFILHEKYADAMALDAHKNSEHYQNIVVKEIIPHLEIREVMIVKKLF